MYRSYQPMKPVTNRYLQQRWDQTNYQLHRAKVSSAQPIVDTKGIKTPAHIQLKLKKMQLQDEHLAIIDRDNRLLSSKLSDIILSKGLVEHRNQHTQRSLNAEKRREELLHVTHQNQAIYQRITARQSEYRRQLWLDDWERAERRREDIARYPRELTNKQRSDRRVKFAASESRETSDQTRPSSSSSSSNLFLQSDNSSHLPEQHTHLHN